MEWIIIVDRIDSHQQLPWYSAELEQITYIQTVDRRIRRVTDLDDLGGAHADGVQQRLLDALEVDAVEQQFDGLHRLAVDGQVCRRPGAARCGPCSRRS